MSGNVSEQAQGAVALPVGRELVRVGDETGEAQVGGTEWLPCLAKQ